MRRLVRSLHHPDGARRGLQALSLLSRRPGAQGDEGDCRHRGDGEEQAQARAELQLIGAKISELGELSHDVTQMHYQKLHASSESLLRGWLDFYLNYNNPEYKAGVEDPLPYLETSQHLKELEQRQAFIALQRANIIDRTIALTDRITVIGFFASIFLTATLGFFLVRYTNKSLKRLKTGTQRIGSGELDYRIKNIDDTGELRFTEIDGVDLSRSINLYTVAGRRHSTAVMTLKTLLRAKDWATETSGASRYE